MATKSIYQSDTTPQGDYGFHCQCCSSFYSDPRILSCLHSFCLECLTQIQEEQDSNIANNSSVTCPSCRQSTLLPIEGDVASLPVNLRLAFEIKQNKVINKVLSSPPKACEACEEEDSPSVAYCNDCDDLLCDDCWKVHKTQRALKPHSTFCLEELKQKPRGELVKMVGPFEKSIPNCQHHDNQKLSFYCQTDGCCVPVCVECTVDRHKGHEVKEIEGCEEVDQVIIDLKEKAENQNEDKIKLEKVLKQIDDTKQKIRDRKNEVDDCIRMEFIDVRRIVDQRENELLEKNENMANSKCQRLQTQYDGIQRLAQCIDSCISMTSSATDEYSNVQLLAIANTLLNRANSLQQQYTDTHLDLVDTSNIDVAVDIDVLKKVIATCGNVTDGANGARCSAVLSRQRLGLGAKMLVKVIKRNTSGSLLDASCDGTKIKAKLLFEGKVIDDALDIVRMDDGSSCVCTKSDFKGNHQLSIAVNGQDIQGSPFDLMVVPRRDYTQLDQPVRTITTVAKPRYIAFTNNGDMFVTSQDHRIHVYDAEGNEKFIITPGLQFDSQSGSQFGIPYGIDIHDDIIYVADFENHRIHQLTTGQMFIGTIGLLGSTHWHFKHPHDVKVNPVDGKIYIADTNNDRVQVFNPHWNLSHVISGTIRGNGSFSKPMGIAFDLFGNVCVSANGSDSVLVFNTKGEFIRQFPVDSPTGIAIDVSGYFLVNSYRRSQLSIFDSHGKFAHMVRGVCSGYGIAVSPHDQSVWVADPWNNRLLKF